MVKGWKEFVKNQEESKDAHFAALIQKSTGNSRQGNHAEKNEASKLN